MLRKATAAPAYAERLKGIDPADITSRAATGAAQGRPAERDAPPFGGFIAGLLGSFGRLFTSPGPR